MTKRMNRRDMLRQLGAGAAIIAFPPRLFAHDPPWIPGTLGPGEWADDSDTSRLADWSTALIAQATTEARMSPGLRAIRVGELALGTPYEAFMLEAYLKSGGNPVAREPIALSLTRFDCVTLVESCLAVARASEAGVPPSWARFSREVERMRYRGGVRGGYASRLHYFSEWISDGEKRGLVRDLGQELGGVADTRPLRFMTEHRDSYPALASDTVYRLVGEMERRLDTRRRWIIPRERIHEVEGLIDSGDVLAFATSIDGLDVSHAAFAYRDVKGTLRVLHAPLSGGAVEITRTTLPEYVANIRRATGILVARPMT